MDGGHCFVYAKLFVFKKSNKEKVQASCMAVQSAATARHDISTLDIGGHFLQGRPSLTTPLAAVCTYSNITYRCLFLLIGGKVVSCVAEIMNRGCVINGWRIFAEADVDRG